MILFLLLYNVYTGKDTELDFPQALSSTYSYEDGFSDISTFLFFTDFEGFFFDKAPNKHSKLFFNILFWDILYYWDRDRRRHMQCNYTSIFKFPISIKRLSLLFISTSSLTFFSKSSKSEIPLFNENPSNYFSLLISSFNSLMISSIFLSIITFCLALTSLIWSIMEISAFFGTRGPL